MAAENDFFLRFGSNADDFAGEVDAGVEAAIASVERLGTAVDGLSQKLDGTLGGDLLQGLRGDLRSISNDMATTFGTELRGALERVLPESLRGMAVTVQPNVQTGSGTTNVTSTPTRDIPAPAAATSATAPTLEATAFSKDLARSISVELGAALKTQLPAVFGPMADELARNVRQSFASATSDDDRIVGGARRQARTEGPFDPKSPDGPDLNEAFVNLERPMQDLTLRINELIRVTAQNIQEASTGARNIKDTAPEVTSVQAMSEQVGSALDKIGEDASRAENELVESVAGASAELGKLEDFLEQLAVIQRRLLTNKPGAGDEARKVLGPVEQARQSRVVGQVTLNPEVVTAFTEASSKQLQAAEAFTTAVSSFGEQIPELRAALENVSITLETPPDQPPSGSPAPTPDTPPTSPAPAVADEPTIEQRLIPELRQVFQDLQRFREGETVTPQAVGEALGRPFVSEEIIPRLGGDESFDAVITQMLQPGADFESILASVSDTLLGLEAVVTATTTETESLGASNRQLSTALDSAKDAVSTGVQAGLLAPERREPGLSSAESNRQTRLATARSRELGSLLAGTAPEGVADIDLFDETGVAEVLANSIEGGIDRASVLESAAQRMNLQEPMRSLVLSVTEEMANEARKSLREQGQSAAPNLSQAQSGLRTSPIATIFTEAEDPRAVKMRDMAETAQLRRATANIGDQRSLVEQIQSRGDVVPKTPKARQEFDALIDEFFEMMRLALPVERATELESQVRAAQVQATEPGQSREGVFSALDPAFREVTEVARARDQLLRSTLTTERTQTVDEGGRPVSRPADLDLYQKFLNLPPGDEPGQFGMAVQQLNARIERLSSVLDVRMSTGGGMTTGAIGTPGKIARAGDLFARTEGSDGPVTGAPLGRDSQRAEMGEEKQIVNAAELKAQAIADAVAQRAIEINASVEELDKINAITREDKDILARVRIILEQIDSNIVDRVTEIANQMGVSATPSRPITEAVPGLAPRDIEIRNQAQARQAERQAAEVDARRRIEERLEASGRNLVVRTDREGRAAGTEWSEGRFDLGGISPTQMRRSGLRSMAERVVIPQEAGGDGRTLAFLRNMSDRGQDPQYMRPVRQDDVMDRFRDAPDAGRNIIATFNQLADAIVSLNEKVLLRGEAESTLRALEQVEAVRPLDDRDRADQRAAERVMAQTSTVGDELGATLRLMYQAPDPVQEQERFRAQRGMSVSDLVYGTAGARGWQAEEAAEVPPIQYARDAARSARRGALMRRYDEGEFEGAFEGLDPQRAGDVGRIDQLLIQAMNPQDIEDGRRQLSQALTDATNAAERDFRREEEVRQAQIAALQKHANRLNQLVESLGGVTAAPDPSRVMAAGPFRSVEEQSRLLVDQDAADLFARRQQLEAVEQNQAPLYRMSRGAGTERDIQTALGVFGGDDPLASMREAQAQLLGPGGDSPEAEQLQQQLIQIFERGAELEAKIQETTDKINELPANATSTDDLIQDRTNARAKLRTEVAPDLTDTQERIAALSAEREARERAMPGIAQVSRLSDDQLMESLTSPEGLRSRPEIVQALEEMSRSSLTELTDVRRMEQYGAQRVGAAAGLAPGEMSREGIATLDDLLTYMNQLGSATPNAELEAVEAQLASLREELARLEAQAEATARSVAEGPEALAADINAGRTGDVPQELREAAERWVEGDVYSLRQAARGEEPADSGRFRVPMGDPRLLDEVMRSAPASSPELLRFLNAQGGGVLGGGSEVDFSQLQPGQRFNLPPSSFTSDPNAPAMGAFTDYDTMLRTQPNARALNLDPLLARPDQAEWLASGDFEVVSVTEEGGRRVIEVRQIAGEDVGGGGEDGARIEELRQELNNLLTRRQELTRDEGPAAQRVLSEQYGETDRRVSDLRQLLGGRTGMDIPNTESERIGLYDYLQGEQKGALPGVTGANLLNRNINDVFEKAAEFLNVDPNTLTQAERSTQTNVRNQLATLAGDARFESGDPDPITGERRRVAGYNFANETQLKKMGRDPHEATERVITPDLVEVARESTKNALLTMEQDLDLQGARERSIEGNTNKMLIDVLGKLEAAMQRLGDCCDNMKSIQSGRGGDGSGVPTRGEKGIERVTDAQLRQMLVGRLNESVAQAIAEGNPAQAAMEIMADPNLGPALSRAQVGQAVSYLQQEQTGQPVSRDQQRDVSSALIQAERIRAMGGQEAFDAFRGDGSRDDRMEATGQALVRTTGSVDDSMTELVRAFTPTSDEADALRASLEQLQDELTAAGQSAQQLAEAEKQAKALERSQESPEKREMRYVRGREFAPGLFDPEADIAENALAVGRSKLEADPDMRVDSLLNQLDSIYGGLDAATIRNLDVKLRETQVTEQETRATQEATAADEARLAVLQRVRDLLPEQMQQRLDAGDLSAKEATDFLDARTGRATNVSIPQQRQLQNIFDDVDVGPAALKTANTYIDNAATAIANNGGRVQRALELLFGGRGSVLQNVTRTAGNFIARYMGGALVFGFASQMRTMMSSALETEQTYIRITAALEATGRATDGVRSRLQDIAVDTNVAVNDTYEVMAQLAGVFETTEETLEATKVVNQLELISQGALSTKEAYTALTAVTAAFQETLQSPISEGGKGFTDFEAIDYVADLSTRIQDLTGVNIEDTTQGLARLGETANTLGIEMELIASAIALTVKATGQSGQGASEQIGRIMAQFQSADAQDLLVGLGITDQQTVLVGDFNRVMKDLFENYQNLSNAEQRQVANTLGDPRQFALTNALLNQGSVALQTYEQSLDSSGAAAERQEAILSTLRGQMGVLGRQIEVIVQNLVEMGLLNVFEILVKGINMVLRPLADLLQMVHNLKEANPFVSWGMDIAMFLVGLRVVKATLGAMAKDAGRMFGTDAAMGGFGNLVRRVRGRRGGGPEAVAEAGEAVSPGGVIIPPTRGPRQPAATTEALSRSARAREGLRGAWRGLETYAAERPRLETRPTQAIGDAVATTRARIAAEVAATRTTIARVRAEGVGTAAARQRATVAAAIDRQMNAAKQLVIRANIALANALNGTTMAAAKSTTANVLTPIGGAAARGAGAVGRGAMAMAGRAAAFLASPMGLIGLAMAVPMVVSAFQKGTQEIIDSIDEMAAARASRLEAMRTEDESGETDEAKVARTNVEKVAEENEKWTSRIGESARVFMDAPFRSLGRGLLSSTIGAIPGVPEGAFGNDAAADAIAGFLPEDVQGELDKIFQDILAARDSGDEDAARDMEKVLLEAWEEIYDELPTAAQKANFQEQMIGYENLQGDVVDAIVRANSDLADAYDFTLTEIDQLVSSYQYLQGLDAQAMAKYGAAIQTIISTTANLPEDAENVLREMSRPGVNQQNFLAAQDDALQLAYEQTMLEIQQIGDTDPERLAAANETLRGIVSARAQLDQLILAELTDVPLRRADIARRMGNLGEAQRELRSAAEAWKTRAANAREGSSEEMEAINGHLDALREAAELSILEEVFQYELLSLQTNDPLQKLSNEIEIARLRMEAYANTPGMADEIREQLKQIAQLQQSLADEQNRIADAYEQFTISQISNPLARANAEYADAMRRYRRAVEQEAGAAAIIDAAREASEAARAVRDQINAINDARAQLYIEQTRSPIASANMEYSDAMRRYQRAIDQDEGPEAIIAAAREVESAARAQREQAESYRVATANLAIAQMPRGATLSRAMAELAEVYAAQRNTIREFGRNSAEYINSMAEVITAQQTIEDEIRNIISAQFSVALALANAAGLNIEASKIELEQARGELERALQDAGGDQNASAVREAYARVISAEANVRDRVLDEALGTVDFMMEMEEITANEAIAALTEIMNTMDLTQEQERNIRRKIKGLQDSLADSLSGGFNIADVRLPTPYEVRRSLGVDRITEGVEEGQKALEEAFDAASKMKGGTADGSRSTLDNILGGDLADEVRNVGKGVDSLLPPISQIPDHIEATLAQTDILVAEAEKQLSQLIALEEAQNRSVSELGAVIQPPIELIQASSALLTELQERNNELAVIQNSLQQLANDELVSIDDQMAALDELTAVGNEYLAQSVGLEGEGNVLLQGLLDEVMAIRTEINPNAPWANMELPDLPEGMQWGVGGLPRIPGRWTGGPVSANQPYRVGEYGEELFVPNTAGMIVNANDLNAMRNSYTGGGDTIVYNQRFDTTIRVQAETNANPDQIARTVERRVTESMRRSMNANQSTPHLVRMR